MSVTSIVLLTVAMLVAMWGAFIDDALTVLGAVLVIMAALYVYAPVIKAWVEASP